MWAGGKTEYQDRVRVGDRLHKRSKIADVAFKNGSTGPLCFVTIDHTISTDRGVAVLERQDIVFRGEAISGSAPAVKAPAASSPKPQHQRHLVADSVLLFRYSAVMFNGHRIHYDRQYAMEAEGYAGLVVHGPLQAALLAEMAESIKGRPLDVFAHRGAAPLFDGPFTLNAVETADALELWTASPSGLPAMRATASWRR
jgi:3-methylfumaryl-CoA hydratase